MQPPKISTILVNYNNSSDTVKCLESLKESDYPNLDIIVVDNASDVHEEQALQHYLENGFHHEFEFIASGHNTGYSGGNNIGIRHALKNDADYILILNPDTTLEKDALSEMMNKIMSNNKIGIVGPIIDEGDRKVAGGRIEWLKPELGHIESGRLDYLTGACLLVKREVFEKVATERERGSTKAQQGVRGLFDERYFLYFEDVDLCIRAQEVGYKLAIAEKALIHHEVSSTTSKMGAGRLLRYHYRNALLFNFKNAPASIKIALPFWSFGIIIKQLLKIIFNKERLISREILMGVVDFHLNKFGKIT